MRVLSRMARPRLLDTPQLPEGLLVQWCGERALLSKSGGRMHSACTRCSCWNHPPSHRFFTSPKRFTRCSLTSLPSVHTLFCVHAGYCHNGTCTCYPGYHGLDCATKLCPNFCSFHGSCEHGKCICEANFTGDACQHARCPGDCTAPGRFERCTDEGACVCKPGFSGRACEHASTAVCRERGTVIPGSGKCRCDAGWTGDTCELPACPHDRHGRGLCVAGGCYCAPGFGGADCSELNCACEGGERTIASISMYGGSSAIPTAVSRSFSWASLHAVADKSLASPANNHNGLAAAAIETVLANLTEACACTCFPFERAFGVGPLCKSPCPAGCSGHGQCDKLSGTCTCDEGWSGRGCSHNDCSNGGEWFLGECVCAPGRSGPNCEVYCPNDCSGHGKCDASLGKCVCDAEWTGAGCAESKSGACDPVCANGGHCLDGACHCALGFTGASCELRTCPGMCSGHGECKPWGQCDCHAGFSGEACETRTPSLDCAFNCSGVGTCVHGACMCPNGRTGATCERPTCANGCSGHGFCKASGECVCEAGWGGFDCSALGLPAGGCGPHGTPDLKRLVCKCESGWTGASCNERTCPGTPTPCSARGLCVNGTCYCHPSASGPGCENPACPNECSQNGLCAAGRCECFRGYEGADCSLASGGGASALAAAAGQGGGGGGSAVAQLNAERCGGRCAGVCLARCRSQLEGGESSPSLGRRCYAACSRTCLASCVVHKARDGRTVPQSDADVPQLALPIEPTPASAAATTPATTAAAEAHHHRAVEEQEDVVPHAGESSAVAGLERQAVDELAQLLASLNDKRKKR